MLTFFDKRCVSAIELSLSNVLIPECTDGTTYNAIYCDASLSEEDLPTFLSLLKPGGRMVVVIEEEALLVTRSTNPHDFEREVIAHVSIPQRHCLARLEAVNCFITFSFENCAVYQTIMCFRLLMAVPLKFHIAA